MNLNPFVYWGQTKEKILLKVDLTDVKDSNINIDEEKIEFSAIGLGVAGVNNYQFTLLFYLPINDQESQYRFTDRCIEFQIKKVGIGEVWPRLTYDTKKPPWLKIDFDNFQFEDDSDDNADGDNENSHFDDSLLKDMEIKYKQEKSFWSHDMLSLYLFIYNLFQWIGYNYVFFTICFRYFKYGEESKKSVFESVGSQLMFCQIVAIMELAHSVLGWVKSGTLTTFFQIFGRNLVLFGLIYSEPKLQDKEVIWWLFATWSVVELVRFPYYMLSLLKTEIKIITWLRYTIWIPLYPLGFFLEGLTMLTSLRYFEMSKRWSFFMPNFWNFSFIFPYFLRVYMIGFLFGAYYLMRTMYNARKKKYSKRSLKQD